MDVASNHLPRRFYFVSLAAFLFQLTSHITRPIFTLYVLDLGASLIQAGFILSVQSLLMIVTRMPLTLLAQKVGEDRMIIVAFLVQATAPILYFLAPSPFWLYFIPFYEILATGCFNQLAMSKVSQMAPMNRQGDALGRYMTLFSMGMFVGPVISGTLLSYIGYRQLYFVTTIFPTLGLILFLRYALDTSIQTSISNLMQTKRDSSFFVSLKKILSEKNVLVLSIIRTFYSFSNTIFTTLFAVYAVEQLGLTPSLAALLFSILGFANAFVKLPAGSISDKVGGKKVLLITFTTIVVDFIAIATFRNLFLLSASLIVFGACWGARAVTEWSYLARTVPKETRTLAMSYLSIFWGIGSTVGSTIAGVFGELMPISQIFLIASLINLPSIPLILMMRSHDSSLEK